MIDRAKGVIRAAGGELALVAHDMPASRQALTLMQDEEAGGSGLATAPCSGVNLAQGGRRFC